MTTGKPISAAYPFESKYVEVHGARMHYIEQGSGDPVLFLHGNPTSSYLWRNIIPHLSPRARCIAPDLIGMGRSDKPGIDYRFLDHARYLDGFIEALGLRSITLVIHDWGSALGFHYARRHESNVRGIAFMEAILRSVSSWEDLHPDFRRVFRLFRKPLVGWALIAWMNIFIEKLLPGSVMRPLTQEEMNHYRAPYRTVASRKPLWRWPNEIPIAGHPAEVVQAVDAYHEWLRQTEIPKLLFHVHPGVILPRPMVEWCQDNLRNLTTVDLGHGLHFIQEDHPDRIGKEIAAWHASL